MPLVGQRKIQAFRSAFGTELDSLDALYRDRVGKMLTILNDAESSLFQKQRAKALFRQYYSELQDLNAEAAAWIEKNIPAAYFRGVEFAETGARNAQRLGINLDRTDREVFLTVHREAAAAIAQEMIRTSEFAIAQVGRRVGDVFRTVGVQEVARGIVSGEARRTVSNAIIDRLRAEGQPFFQDKLGRHWRLEDYAEMVARTTTREAMSQGTRDRLHSYGGIQLAMVSAHNAEDFCIYYENMIVSVGPVPHPVYPPISAINGGPPFHPHCRHVLTPFVEELANEKELALGMKAYENFTKGDMLGKSPAQLQRKFRIQYPDRARAEARRIRNQSAKAQISRERKARKEERLIRQAVEDGRKMSSNEVKQIVARVQRAEFSTDSKTPSKYIIGKEYQGVKFEGKVPSDIAHLGKRVLHEKQWPSGTTLDEYVSDLRKAMGNSEARVYTYLRGKGPKAEDCVGILAPNHVKAEESQPWIWIAYSAKDGRIITGYQASSPQAIDTLTKDIEMRRLVRHR